MAGKGEAAGRIKKSSESSASSAGKGEAAGKVSGKGRFLGRFLDVYGEGKASPESQLKRKYMAKMSQTHADKAATAAQQLVPPTPKWGMTRYMNSDMARGR